MESKTNFFEDFKGISKAEWLEKVTQDLKGKPLEDLNWHLENGLNMTPFHHRDDLKGISPAPFIFKENNEWEIGEKVFVENVKKANKRALDGLMNGVESLQFVIDRDLSESDLEDLLANIEMDYISTRFQVKNENNWGVLKMFAQIAQQKGKTLSTLKGAYDLIEASIPSDDLLKWSKEKLPAFKMINIHTKKEGNIVADLGAMTKSTADIIRLLLDRGHEIANILSYFHFTVNVGCTYFVEIARLRALKLLWGNLQKAYGVANITPPSISAQFQLSSQTTDPHQNMIRATTLAMSAVVGGVDHLTVMPANTTFEDENEMTRRIARNVQHLLKMESYMDRVIDPVAGSYYIEKLTADLAQKAWTQFQEM